MSLRRPVTTLALLLAGAASRSVVLPPAAFALSQAPQEPVPLLTTRISDDPACSRCRIVLAPVVTVGRAADAYAIPGMSYIAVDSRGRSYVASPRGAEGVAMFGGDGAFQRYIGRAGHGPGELEGVTSLVVDSGDSLFVMDFDAVVLFSPAASLVREYRRPPGSRGLFFTSLGDGRIVMGNYAHSTPALLLVDAQSNLVRSFGRTLTRSSYDPDRLQFALARGNNGDIIAAQMNNQYVIDIWDTTGVLRRRLERQAGWFPPWSRQATPRREGDPAPRPMPHISHVFVDSHNRLWSSGLVAERRWRPLATIPEVRDLRRQYDTIIEVIDLSSDRLILSQRFDEALFLLDGGLLASMSEDEDGLLHYLIWRAEIRQ